LSREVEACRICPRLVAWREQVARERVARFRDQEYWGRPVPGFGDPDPRVLVVGLAPAAHGANRTGRMFTGDRSGDWLYSALYRAGFASQPDSSARDDGLTLTGLFVTAAVRCAPPANKPTTAERKACRPYLERELRLFERVSVIVALGGLAWQEILRVRRSLDWPTPRPLPRFGHCAEVALEDELTLIGSYHPSQQNTFTGRLTEQMFDAVWQRVRVLSG